MNILLPSFNLMHLPNTIDIASHPHIAQLLLYVAGNYLPIATLLIAMSICIFSRYKTQKNHQSKNQLHGQEIARLRERNKNLVGEREWLLKEIHHRVKNNLQIVISLLNTQSVYLDSEEALLAVKNSEHRMYAMSLIHQKLYQTESLSCINIKQYTRDLIDYLENNLGNAKSIRYHLKIDDINFDVSQALPLGLIMNEVITNAIKYAFPADQQRKKINISLLGGTDADFVLQIGDNGNGMPNTFDFNEDNSLGMKLIKGLSRQLDGNLEIKNSNGCQITIEFKRIK
ncbi:MAG: sensor histidine kinase, partial [Chitinophagaceae bacterium]